MADSRLLANIKGIGIALIPRYFFQKRLQGIFQEILKLSDKDLEKLSKRVHYYNKIGSDFRDVLFRSKDKERIGKFPFRKTSQAFDGYKISKYFNDDFLWIKKYGDINYNLTEPSICKSRPISGEILQSNSNNVLLLLGSNRHFIFLKDKRAFEDKQDKAVWRGAACQSHRIKFLENYFGKEFCDLGNTRKKMLGGGDNNLSLFEKSYLSKEQQLDFKFIISLEGNDVASNLKWAMSSNSLVLAPKMNYETWFMEGSLKPNEHFALIDNTNLGEVIEHFKTHPKEAKQIIENAHHYIGQFLNPKLEFYIGILVLTKYFYYSNQFLPPQEILPIIRSDD